MNPDGSGVRRLTEQTGVAEAYPDWSPTGEKIAFAATGPSGEHSVAVAHWDGSGVQALVSFGLLQAIVHPRWSPDGSKIAFLTYHPEGHAPPMYLYVVDADGGEPQLLSTEANIDTQLTWSPDSSHLAFTLAIGGIGVINADGTGFAQIVSSGNAFGPAWSPTDPDTLAFLYLGAGVEQQEVWKYTFSAGETQLLATISHESGGLWEDGPAWSPDGERLAAVATMSRETLVSRLYALEPDGSRVDVLAEISPFSVPPFFAEPQFNHRHAWSADGGMIALAGSVGDWPPESTENLEIYVVDVASGFAQNVTNDPSADYDPHWRPVQAGPMPPAPSATATATSTATATPPPTPAATPPPGQTPGPAKLPPTGTGIGSPSNAQRWWPMLLLTAAGLLAAASLIVCPRR
jgi:Tol biopolymer transport system component